MKVAAVIMCHNSPDTTERLRKELLSVVDRLWVVDSGSDKDSRARKTDEVIYCDNLYWTGCWNYAIQLFRETDADILWVIGGDIELRGDPKKHIECMKSAMPFGGWHPGVDGVSRALVQHSKAQGNAWEVWHLEGIAMAISRQAMHQIDGLPEDNKYGWGLDIWMNWRCWKAGMRNVLDGRVKIFHPDLRGYSSYNAHSEMFVWLESKLGKNYRDELHFWSDGFDYNKIRVMDERFGVSVVVTAYNQLGSLKLALESFRFQTVKPIEVVVSDDGSTDGTIEWLDSLEVDAYPFQVSYFTFEHEGYNLARAYNEAALRCKGNRIIFTNADFIHSRNSVKYHMSLSDDKIGMGRIGNIPFPKSKMVNAEHVKDEKLLDSMVENNCYVCNARIQGGNFSVSAAIFSALDGFSQDYFGKYGGESVEFFDRASEKGYGVGMASLEECAILGTSCGFHLAHSERAYKESQWGNKLYQAKHLGAKA